MATIPGHLQFPSSSQIVDADGNLTPVWRAYFERLYLRSGGSATPPYDITTLAAALAAEVTARTQGDASLQTQLNAEQSQRMGADSAEASVRIAADTGLAQAIDTERTNRTAADALLLPRTGGAITGNLSVSGTVSFTGLPTSSTGLPAGSLWNNAGVLHIV